ncbi:MAG TPA: DUF2384 domain-containing protein [Rhodanobacteraceae bacterium]|nr:DUF2384 domain-containing protein [Rhodanobacteraceae bacterium]
MNVMPSRTRKFDYIASEITKATARREALVLEAFDVLETSHPSLSQAVLVYLGNKRRASHWLCTPRSAWQGKSPCELLADGDQDSLWDLLQGYEDSAVSRPFQA